MGYLYKNKEINGFFAFLFILFALICVSPAHAQNETKAKTPKELAGMMATSCPGAWETQACLSNVSETVLHMAADYAAMLQKAGHSAAIERLKQKCAAATAATSQEVPAYALESALTECANNVFDIQNQVNIKPNKNLYQIIVVSTLCLSKDKRCAEIEDQLMQYR